MFDLHITCTKDITKIAIDFADGTCVCTEAPKVPKENARNENVDIPDWASYNKKPKFETVKPPEVPDADRQPKIDEVLNNFEI